jgi:hypothetical protein
LSNTIALQGHPCLVLEELSARYGTNLTFTYSRYKVAPSGLQAMAPRSPVLKVTGHDISLEWLVDQFSELRLDQEMAWHSWVEDKHTVFHIPMIDFIGRPDHSLILSMTRTLTTELELKGDLFLFDTGRSLHGYYPDLIPEHAWPKYLGLLLLLNQHSHPPLIDTRWIGHALTRGFTALRWSNNTSRYRSMPRMVSVAEVSAR